LDVVAYSVASSQTYVEGMKKQRRKKWVQPIF